MQMNIRISTHRIQVDFHSEPEIFEQNSFAKDHELNFQTH